MAEPVLILPVPSVVVPVIQWIVASMTWLIVSPVKRLVAGSMTGLVGGMAIPLVTIWSLYQRQSPPTASEERSSWKHDRVLKWTPLRRASPYAGVQGIPPSMHHQLHPSTCTPLHPSP